MKKKTLMRVSNVDTLVADFMDNVSMKDILTSLYGEDFVKVVLKYALDKNPIEAESLFKKCEYSFFEDDDDDIPNDVIVENYALEKLSVKYIEWKLLSGELD